MKLNVEQKAIFISGVYAGIKTAVSDLSYTFEKSNVEIPTYRIEELIKREVEKYEK